MNKAHAICVFAAALAGCTAMAPREARGPAEPAQAQLACDSLGAVFRFDCTRVASAEPVAAGQLKVPGIAQAMPEHCVVKGAMRERTSAIDGKRYAIAFEMRLPAQWNGRFFYQANGGQHGFVAAARLPGEYDGILASRSGWRLPLAATALAA